MADNNSAALEAILTLLPELSDDEKSTIAGEIDAPRGNDAAKTRSKSDPKQLAALIPRGIGR
ncbi:hypothetical protein [Rhodococcus sp. ACPA1]|uniref:hypothetical protein n=1 Tax=Rhodococcus sp. ACPA1 TaxID=2028572 RepID=UPI000BB13777|nr:hypothetical protein [Rhodococcus sp. ACPA1]PBC54896.1 hypothetical protein CJ177_17960 [Rhodococcus sp. ACPA1]